MEIDNRSLGLTDLGKCTVFVEVVKLSFALILVMFLCDSVDASSTASAIPSSPSQATKEGPHSWKDPNREECTFSCLYNKANENIGLQLKYIVRKLEALESAPVYSKREALGSFCRENEGGAIDKCFRRYKKLQVYVMRKMQAAMVQNYHSATMISNSKNATEKTKPYVVGLVPESEAKKERQAPYVVTFEDLKKDYAEMIRLGGIDFKRWADQLPTEPSKEDFAEFQEIPRDPNHPNAGTFLVLARDQNGEIKFNKKAYEAARLRYKETVQAELARAGIEKSRSRSRDSDSHQLAGVKRQADLEKEVGSLNRSAFAEAEKFRVESSVPAGGNGAIASQRNFDFGSGGSKQPGSSSVSANTSKTVRSETGSDASLKREVKVMTIDELKQQGVSSLFHSPEAIGKYIDRLEREIDTP